MIVSVNHKLPSGPAVMPPGESEGGKRNTFVAPVGVIRPILLLGPLVVPETSVNHALPSGPTMMAGELLPAIGSVNRLTFPLRGGPNVGDELWDDELPAGAVLHPAIILKKMSRKTNM